MPEGLGLCVKQRAVHRLCHRHLKVQVTRDFKNKKSITRWIVAVQFTKFIVVHGFISILRPGCMQTIYSLCQKPRYRTTSVLILARIVRY